MRRVAFSATLPAEAFSGSTGEGAAANSVRELLERLGENVSTIKFTSQTWAVEEFSVKPRCKANAWFTLLPPWTGFLEASAAAKVYAGDSIGAGRLVLARRSCSGSEFKLYRLSGSRRVILPGRHACFHGGFNAPVIGFKGGIEPGCTISVTARADVAAGESYIVEAARWRDGEGFLVLINHDYFAGHKPRFMVSLDTALRLYTKLAGIGANVRFVSIGGFSYSQPQAGGFSWGFGANLYSRILASIVDSASIVVLDLSIGAPAPLDYAAVQPASTSAALIEVHLNASTPGFFLASQGFTVIRLSRAGVSAENIMRTLGLNGLITDALGELYASTIRSRFFTRSRAALYRLLRAVRGSRNSSVRVWSSLQRSLWEPVTAIDGRYRVFLGSLLGFLYNTARVGRYRFLACCNTILCGGNSGAKDRCTWESFRVIDSVVAERVDNVLDSVIG